MQQERFTGSCEKDLAAVRRVTDESADIKYTRFTINGTDCAIVSAEGMLSSLALAEQVFAPLVGVDGSARSGAEIMRFVTSGAPLAADNIAVYEVEKAVQLVYSGFALFLCSGSPCAAAVGIQGYEKRAVSTPVAENDLFGSQEAFTESVRVNMSLIRRRLKSDRLKFELATAGELSNTDVCLVYVRGKADSSMLSQIRSRLKNTGLEGVLGAGDVKPFLEERTGVGLFSGTGYTERPDVLCADLLKGYIGIIVDGSPFCIVCPYLLTRSFETMDDQSSKTYYAVFIKLIRYTAFLLAVMFPGLYLAAVNFHPELLDMKLLLNLSLGEKTTVVTLFTEMVVIMILLEIMREASVRLPRAIGTAMSIAGALMIGDTAVKSGLISSPLLIIVGITASASFVLPQLSQQITVLRLMFLIAGGFAGVVGISLCTVMTLTNICSQSLSGVALTAPVMPFKRSRIMNVLGRMDHLSLAAGRTRMADLT